MSIEVPSKTYLVGEYAVLQGGPALLLTTPPCFRYDILTKEFFDPYAGRGGFGASSAKFIVEAKARGESDPWEIWSQYRHSGLAGSGADVIAQCCGGLVYFHAQAKQLEKLTWPFAELSFALIHTGQKLLTHEHLASLSLQSDSISKIMPTFNAIVQTAYAAIKNLQPTVLLQAIKDYGAVLADAKLVAPHTQQLLETLQRNEAVLAAKGCGAMGSDVVLVIIPTAKQADFTAWVQRAQLQLIFCGNSCYA